MYGLLLESFSNFIKLQWGEASWEAVRRHAGNEPPTFCIHQIYAETLIPRLTQSAVQVLGVEERELFEAMGVYFVDFVGQFGYDQVMSVLGRHMRDFLNGLDNLHEYLKFSYPRMRAPSFFCEHETVDGMILHYRSKRRGFVYYTMGQIKQVAKRFYETDCHINLLKEELDGCAIHVTFELKFDNRAFIRDKTESLMARDEQLLPFRTYKLFELFPFCIVFSQEMIIRQTGYSLLTILKDLVGLYVTEAFDIVRPIIPVTFNSILERQNNSFELVTLAPINTDDTVSLGGDESGKCLRLRGQMLYMEEWKCIMFLATPVMPDLDSLMAAGLFINDLSLHDCSRDFVLAGTQQSVELRLALHQEQLKTRKLEDSMRKLDDEMKRTDELLYQMIPKTVADRIRNGVSPIDTCQVFDAVSILFSDIVTFTEICSRITPMLVVSMLNHMYSLFDQLTERNGVYKVETIGDSYMVVSGAPTKEINHADRICDMAMDMIDASAGIFDPSRDGEHLKIRVGIHSGNVVAGVVGLKMPRYCLFGDTVNTSSRMESTSESGKIQISEATKYLLPDQYETEYRGEVPMKGKGKMNTYWLISRNGRVPLSQLECSAITWAAPAIGVYSSTSNIVEGNYFSSSVPRERTASSPRMSTHHMEMIRRAHRTSESTALHTYQPFELKPLPESVTQVLNNSSIQQISKTTQAVQKSARKLNSLKSQTSNRGCESSDVEHVEEISCSIAPPENISATLTRSTFEFDCPVKSVEGATCLGTTKSISLLTHASIPPYSFTHDFAHSGEAVRMGPLISSSQTEDNVAKTNYGKCEFSNPNNSKYSDEKSSRSVKKSTKKIGFTTAGTLAQIGCSVAPYSDRREVISQTCSIL